MAEGLKQNIASVVNQYGVANDNGEFIFSIPNFGHLIVIVYEVMGLTPTRSDVHVLLEGNANVTPFEHLEPIDQARVSDFVMDNCYSLGRIGLDSLNEERELDWIVEPLVVAISEEMKLGGVGVYVDEDDEGKINVISIFDTAGEEAMLTAYKDTDESISLAKSDIDLWIEQLNELKERL